LRDSGDTSWLKLFKRNNSNTKQILMVHDGNMPQRFPYLATIIHNFDEIVGVHPASYNMACGLGLPVSLIVNPQDLSKVDKTKDNYHNKQKKTIFALGTWKASKRFQDIVKAVPWIDPEAKIDIVGEGL
jgi:glycosyltransferase involved in cell wall biosynthesis